MGAVRRESPRVDLTLGQCPLEGKRTERFFEAWLRAEHRNREVAQATCSFAGRDIQAGAEITFDYSTCFVDEPTLTTCHCGAAKCRGKAVDFRSLQPELQAWYLANDAVPTYAQGGSSIKQSRELRRRAR